MISSKVANFSHFEFYNKSSTHEIQNPLHISYQTATTLLPSGRLVGNYLPTKTITESIFPIFGIALFIFSLFKEQKF